MEIEQIRNDWDLIVTLVVCSLTAAYTAAYWLHELRPSRARVLGVNDANNVLITLTVLGLIAFTLHLTISDSLGSRLPSFLYFGIPILASGFAISAFVGQLLERESFWILDDNKRTIGFKWDRIRKVVVLPVIAPFAPLATGALKRAPELISLLRA